MKPITKTVYSNNKKGPRMRKGKFSKKIITKDLWAEFTSTFPEYKEISWNSFYKAWLDIAETIRTEAMTNPQGVKLGSYTGELKLQYISPEFKGADYKTSQELGTKISYPNLQSRGKVAVIRWERRWAVKFNKILGFFGFEPTREMVKIKVEHADKNPEKIRVARVRDLKGMGKRIKIIKE